MYFVDILLLKEFIRYYIFIVKNVFYWKSENKLCFIIGCRREIFYRCFECCIIENFLNYFMNKKNL